MLKTLRMLCLTPLGRWVAALACLILLLPVSSASGQDVWRLAGTFNGWNTHEASYELSPVQGHTGVFALERVFEPGAHHFKFVRNGDWGAGHLGESGPGTLDTPGADIPLELPTLAKLRITLDTNTNIWRREIAEIDRPVIVAHTLGTPMVGEPFVVDYSETLSNTPIDELGIDYRLDEGSSDAAEITASTRRGQLTITPARPGPLGFSFSITDGETTTEHIEVNVQPGRELFTGRPLGSPRFDQSELEYQWDGSWRSIITARRDTPIGIALTEGGRELERQEVELSSGESVLVSAVDEQLTIDADVHAVRLVYAPNPDVARPRTVHLVGDFNGWARAGSEKAIELLPRLDGTFSVTLALPAGTFAYAFLLDGRYEVANPGASRSAGNRSFLVVGPTADELGPAKPNHINMAGVRHAPELSTDFTGISDGLGLFDVSITTLAGDVESVQVAGAPVSEEVLYEPFIMPMRKVATVDGFDRWQARLRWGMAPDSEGRVSYSFFLHDGDTQEFLPVPMVTIEPAIDLPDWAKGAVWYQIFAERFRNGNPLNDPAEPFVYLEEWTADWYSIDDDERRAWHDRTGVPFGEPMPERQGGDLYHVVWDRRYGGDLQGVVEKLGYLKDLGVTAIYFNPVFEGESMHKYDATAYHHIDDNFGRPASAGPAPPIFEYPEGEDPADPSTWGWTPADRYFIDEFLPAARSHGIRVVIDGVWNHTGRQFWAWQDIIEKGNRSPYADWFYADYAADGSLESWRAWDGPSGWLPKFKQQPNGDLVEPVKEHIFAVTSRWMDPNGDGDPSDGIDGWRLDVPLDIGLPFWVDWRKHVKSINPDAVIIAEIWTDREADPVITGQHFDTHMHYPFAMAVVDWLAVRPGMTSVELGDQLAAAFDDATSTNLIHQNLFASHDTDRLVSQLFNPHRGYDQGNRPQDNGPDYDGSRPTQREFDLSLLGVAIQATYLGAPMIYYGDELGAWGADDPTDRKPTPWPELAPMENPDDEHIEGWYERYAEWFNLRSDREIGGILRFGGVRHLDTGHDDVFAFERALNGEQVIVVVNKGATGYDVGELLQVIYPDRIFSNSENIGVGAMSARAYHFDARGAMTAYPK